MSVSGALFWKSACPLRAGLAGIWEAPLIRTILDPAVNNPTTKIDFRRLLSKLRPSPRGAKLGVIVLFTLCWLFVALARSNAQRNNVTLEGSSLVALATSLQQGDVSGRDFHSAFGPGMQILAWTAASITKGNSSDAAYGMIIFVLSVLSAVLLAGLLLVCNRISWRACAVVYVFSFLLNLFFEPIDFRTLLLLLSAAFAYRIISAEMVREQMIWATAAGILCFVSQLVTFDLGIDGIVVIVGALIVGSILSRNAWTLLGIEAVLATVAVANVGLVLFFKLTSANYGMIFDYQNYSFEILRGYHNIMGISWQLPIVQTVVLLLALGYVIARCVMSARESDPLEASLLISFIFAAVIWLQSALVTSDIPHIALAFSPMIVILGVLAQKEWASKPTLALWAATVVAVFLAWPLFNLSAPSDVLQLVSGQTPIGTAMNNIYAADKSSEAARSSDRRSSDSGERRDGSAVSFPYNDHLVGLTTESLESFYIQRLESERATGLHVIYAPDRWALPMTEGVQAITRTPRTFEYIYRNFELPSDEKHPNSHYELHPRHQPHDAAIGELSFSTVHQVVNSGTLNLDAPSTCGLIRLKVRIDYGKNPAIFTPSAIGISLSDGDRPVWRGYVRPLEPNHTFVTYVSPLPPETFHQVFSPGPVQTLKWDKVDYWSVPAGLLGSSASRILIGTLQCLDPQKYVEGTAAQQMASVQ